MVVYVGSRYEDLDKVPYTDNKNESSIGLEIRPIDNVIDNTSLMHTVKSEDRIDLMAAKYYKNSKKWWNVADKNPEIIYPLDVVVGNKVRIP